MSDLQSLEMNKSVVFDANGNGTVRLTPQQGVLWLPTQVRLQNTSTVKFPAGSIYTGSMTFNDQLIDTTTTNIDDTSGRIQGQKIYPGQAVIAVWTGGDPGATGTVTLYGMQSTSYRAGELFLPNLAPGSAFPTRQAPVKGVDLPVIIDQVIGASLAGPSDNYFPGGQTSRTGVYDLSNFNSFRMWLNNLSVGTKPYFAIQLEWYADSSHDQQIMAEYFTFSSNGVDQHGIGTIRAPYLIIRVHNYDNALAGFDMKLYGAQRVEPRTQYHSSSTTPSHGLGIDNVLYNGFHGSIPANTGVVTTQDFNFYNGPVTVNAWCSTTPATLRSIQVTLFALPKGVTSDDNMYEFFLPDNLDFKSPKQFNVAFPRRVVAAQINNFDTNVNNVHLTVTAQEL